jgi:alpha-glucosidase
MSRITSLRLARRSPRGHTLYHARPDRQNRRIVLQRTNISSKWIYNAAIYQIYPLTSRCGKNRSKTGGHYGNIQGIIERLDYICKLGVDAIWITPMFLSPIRDGFGYNVSDYRRIHPLFGTNEEFDQLIAECHKRGLKVILDLVFNHTSNEQDWFQQSRLSKNNQYSDFYVWADPVYDVNGNRCPPNNWKSMDIENPSAWRWDQVRQQYYLHSFNHTMPDLNLHCEAVQSELLEVVDFWLKKGIDGFRLDAVSHMGHDQELRNEPIFDDARGYHGQYHQFTTCQAVSLEFLKRLRQSTEKFQRTLPTSPDTVYSPGLLGEVMAGPEYVELLIRENVLDTVYTGRFGGNLYDFQSIVQDSFLTGSQHARMNWAMSNHDMPRVLDRTMGNMARPEHAGLYMSMLACLPGSICIFQGEELGLRQGSLKEMIRPENDPLQLTASFMTESDASRAAIPWEDQANLNVWLGTPAINLNSYPEAQARNPNSPLCQTQRLIQMRKQHNSLRSLKAPVFIDTHDPTVLCFLRVDPESMEQMLCVFNFDHSPKQIYFSGNDLLGIRRGYRLDCKKLHDAFIINPCITNIFCREIKTMSNNQPMAASSL